MTAAPTILRVRFRARRAHRVPRGREGAAGRPLRLRRRRRVLSLRPPATRPSWSPACSTVMDGADRGAPAGPRGDRLQHRLDPGAAAAARRASRCRSSAPCRRSSRPAPASRSKLVSVLGTEATVQREYTRTLIRDFANGCAVTLVGSPRLAELAEAELKGERVADADIAPKSRPASSSRTARAPTRSCWPAPIIRCCSSGCSSSRPGR